METALKVGTSLVVIGVLAFATVATGGAAAVLAGARISAATASTAASATIITGLAVTGSSLIQAAISNSTNPKHAGKPTYNDKEKNERIEYEYYGNGNGNVHYELGRKKPVFGDLRRG